MVEISLSGSGEGPRWATAPGYSTAPFSLSTGLKGRLFALSSDGSANEEGCPDILYQRSA